MATVTVKNLIGSTLSIPDPVRMILKGRTEKTVENVNVSDISNSRGLQDLILKNAISLIYLSDGGLVRISDVAPTSNLIARVVHVATGNGVEYIRVGQEYKVLFTQNVQLNGMAKIELFVNGLSQDTALLNWPDNATFTVDNSTSQGVGSLSIKLDGREIGSLAIPVYPSVGILPTH